MLFAVRLFCGSCPASWFVHLSICFALLLLPSAASRCPAVFLSVSVRLVALASQHFLLDVLTDAKQIQHLRRSMGERKSDDVS
jgi:hypothetical protein